MSKGMRTEDEVRDSAKLVLGFDKTEDEVQQGTGQITTFNQLGFRGCNDKPDGWYLPDDASKPAIILETKSEAEGVSKEKHVKELFKNIDVIAKKYSKTIGILYSGSAIRVFRNKIELSDASKRLENKDYYIRLCTSQKLKFDNERTITMTKTITAIHSGTVTTITSKTIVVFLPALDLEVDVPVRTGDSTQNIRIPAVGDSATVQVAFQGGDLVATAATFVPQQDIREDIPVSEDDDFFLLDDDDEYDWYSEPPAEDFGFWKYDF